MDTTQLLLIGGGLLLAVAAGYLFMVFNASSKNTQRRLQAMRYRHSGSTKDKVESQLKKAIAARRPRSISTPGSLTRLEALASRLERTGFRWTVPQYLYTSLGIGVAVFLLIVLKTGAFFLALAAGVVMGVGLPHVVVVQLVNRRINAFTSKFPDGIELLVRGLRSGLPVAETLGVVASEVPGPVGSEFRSVVERMRIGRTMEESLQETANKLNTAEFQFFVITLAIQRETGGNLAETLSNLADVLRKRAQMKLKIKAMSSESKASAYIVGALPFAVFCMVYWVNPDYLAGFFSDERLMIAGLGGLVWMTIGGFIMAKMVSFEI